MGKHKNAVQALHFVLGLVFGLFTAVSGFEPAHAFDERALQSTVSVLPKWPGKPVGGTGAPSGRVPEGSGIAVQPSIIVTAYHVVEPAESIEVRLSDGRIFPASLVAFDEASDIAVLRTDANIPAFESAPDPALGNRACIVGNAYGLDLSVTCGVISAANVSDAGFNRVEDFLQTDAAANPGSSGGALVDAEGRLLGMVSAIFASRADTNIGVNFAVSLRLLERVLDDLEDDGKVAYVAAGWQLERLPRQTLQETAGALVSALDPVGVASIAGVQTGDVIIQIADRPIRKPRDVVSALALVRPGETARITLWRDGRERAVDLQFPAEGDASLAADAPENTEPATAEECAYAAAVCRARQAVFPVSAFDPLASSVRIGQKLLVTNRHVVGDKSEVTVFTPFGNRTGRVLPSAYRGDLALIEVEGLPEDGQILTVRGPEELEGPLYAVGADIDRRAVRVFGEGKLVFGPADGAPLGRIHVTSLMQPGVSGGALINQKGELVGIAAGGGEGRYEAIPLDDVAELMFGYGAPGAEAVQQDLGTALVACRETIDTFDPQTALAGTGQAPQIADLCAASQNYGLVLEAGRALGRAGYFEEALMLQKVAAEQVPNSLNAWVSVMVSLQAAGRTGELKEPAAAVLRLAQGQPAALRRAFAAAILSKDRALAETALAEMASAGLPDAATAGQVFKRTWPD